MIPAGHSGDAERTIYTAAMYGDDAAVRRFLELEPALATAKDGPNGWDALTCLCFSSDLLTDTARSENFVGAAKALLEAGASANTGYYDHSHRPEPMFESVLYGAAGIAHHADLTRLLLQHGADPNDEEVPYHAPESYDNAALKLLVESGKLTDDSLTTMLLRKHDWHDLHGVEWLLERGADPNRLTRWHRTPLQQAVERDNSIEIFEALMQHGGHPDIPAAARRGRGDLLDLFEKRGFPIDLEGVDKLIAACARNIDGDRAYAGALKAMGGKLLAEFAGNGNTEGVRRLLDLGIGVGELYKAGDGYFQIAENSTALHVAAWRARHSTVKLLIERGAFINAMDGKGRTPLALAIRACVDSYWMQRRSPESVEALLVAGASVNDIAIPCGYAEVDDLLRRYA